MRDALLVMVVVSIAVAALRMPFFGLLAFVCFGLVNPQSFTWGFGRTFPLALITALGTIVGYLISSESKQWPRGREMYLLIILWILFGVSTISAYFPDRGTLSENALEEWKQISKIFLMIFLSMMMVNTKERLHWLMRVIAISIGFMGVKSAIFVILSGGSFIVWGPEGSFLYANNSIGLAMAMNVPILYYLIKMEPISWLRKMMWVMLICSFPAVICTYSRGAWLALAGATALMFWKSKNKIFLTLAGGIFALALIPFGGALLTFDLVPDRVASRFDELINYESEASAQSRFWNWELCKRVGFANPLTGEGFKFYSLAMYPKYYPEFQEEWGYNQVWSCHSMWLTVLAEHGLVALGVWVSLLVFCFLSLRKMLRISKNDSSLLWIKYYGNMIQIAFVVYGICGTFLDVAYFDLFYQLVAVIVILKALIRRETKDTVVGMESSRRNVECQV